MLYDIPLQDATSINTTMGDSSGVTTLMNTVPEGNKDLEKNMAMDIFEASNPSTKRRKRKVSKDDSLEESEKDDGEEVVCVVDPSLKVVVPENHRIDVVSLPNNSSNVLDKEKNDDGSNLMLGGDPIMPLEEDGATGVAFDESEFPPLNALKEGWGTGGAVSGKGLKKIWVKKPVEESPRNMFYVTKETGPSVTTPPAFIFGIGGEADVGGRKHGKSAGGEPNGPRKPKGCLERQQPFIGQVESLAGNGKPMGGINATPWYPGATNGNGIGSSTQAPGGSWVGGLGQKAQAQGTWGSRVGAQAQCPGGSGSGYQPRPQAQSSPKAQPKNVNAKPYSGLFKENRVGTKGFQLSLVADIEEDVIMDESDEVPFEDTWGFCLIGCFTGPFPGRAALDNIISTWNVKCRAIPYGKGWTIFKFLNEEDRLHVLHGGVYMAYGKTLMLKIVDRGVIFTDDLFMNVPTWVVLLDVPLSVWSESGLSKLASKIGTPIHSDQITKERSMMNYARCLVEVDVSKPPKIDIGVKMPNGKRYVQKVIFENYPSYCHNCRCFGHNHFTCETLNPGIVNKADVTKGTVPRATPSFVARPRTTPMDMSSKKPLVHNIVESSSNPLVTPNPFDVLATEDILISTNEKGKDAMDDLMEEAEGGWQQVGAKNKVGSSSSMESLQPN